jgi:hypothetical protein
MHSASQSAQARALGGRDLDPRRGSLLVRGGKGGRRREIGMDGWGFEQLGPWLAARVELPVRPPVCVMDGPTRGRPLVERPAGTAGVRHDRGDQHAAKVAVRQSGSSLSP